MPLHVQYKEFDSIGRGGPITIPVPIGEALTRALRTENGINIMKLRSAFKYAPPGEVPEVVSTLSNGYYDDNGRLIAKGDYGLFIGIFIIAIIVLILIWTACNLKNCLPKGGLITFTVISGVAIIGDIIYGYNLYNTNKNIDRFQKIATKAPKAPKDKKTAEALKTQVDIYGVSSDVSSNSNTDIDIDDSSADIDINDSSADIDINDIIAFIGKDKYSYERRADGNINTDSGKINNALVLTQFPTEIRNAVLVKMLEQRQLELSELELDTSKLGLDSPIDISKLTPENLKMIYDAYMIKSGGFCYESVPDALALLKHELKRKKMIDEPDTYGVNISNDDRLKNDTFVKTLTNEDIAVSDMREVTPNGRSKNVFNLSIKVV